MPSNLVTSRPNSPLRGQPRPRQGCANAPGGFRGGGGEAAAAACPAGSFNGCRQAALASVAASGHAPHQVPSVWASASRDSPAPSTLFTPVGPMEGTLWLASLCDGSGMPDSILEQVS